MADTQQFPNLPQSTWSCWGTHLVPTLKGEGCDSVQFSGGNSGTLSFNHRVLFDAQFAFTYSYDPSSSALTLTITDKPGILGAGTVFDYVQQRIYNCPQ